ncbi:MAG: hypothetical protein WBA46_17990 [Thermomicrobiales bacterium]
MGCLSRFVVIVAILVQLVSGVLALVVLGSARTMGEAALLNKTDALTILVATGASLLATFVLAIKIWMSSRTKKHLRAS